MAHIVREPVKKGMYQAVNALVDRSAKIYAETTGKKLEGKALVFVKEMIMSMIDLIEESAKSGGTIDPKAIGKLAFSRALSLAGLAADEESWASCGVGVASLALSSVDVFGIMVGAVGMSATGAGAAIGVPVLFASAAFWAIQVNEVVETCGDAYVASTERKFAASHNLKAKRAMVTNYSALVCSM